MILPGHIFFFFFSIKLCELEMQLRMSGTHLSQGVFLEILIAGTDDAMEGHRAYTIFFLALENRVY